MVSPAVAVTARSWLVPPDRWMVELAPPPETFGSETKRLRLARGWSQREIARRTGIEQTEVSKFERDAYRHPKPEVVACYEDMFGLVRGELAHLPWGEGRRQAPRIPGPSIAIGPVEPRFVELLRAAIELDNEQLSDATAQIRLIAEGPLPRDTREEEPAG